MKQTVEEAVAEYIEKHVSRNENASFCAAFRAGVEWKANQSPWISVKERLSETDGYFLVTDGEIFAVAYFFKCWDKFAKYKEYPHPLYDDGVVKLYMPIPTFDEILKSNRDVLERIKEKGD